MAVDATLVPTEIELHRAAAWWGGEGSVVYANRKLAVRLAQKEPTVCYWMVERFGGHVIVRYADKSRTTVVLHEWLVCGDRARAFLTAIRDLLPESPRRQDQIRAALIACAGRRKTGPVPKPFCGKGHAKELGTQCKACCEKWRRDSRAREHVKEAHRKQEAARYLKKKLEKATGAIQ